MIKRITYLIVLMISTSVIVAQNNAIFNGGNADGHDKGCYQQTIPTTIDFGGGDNDGHAKDCYMQSIPQTVDFGGGSNDGHAKDCYMQSIPQTVAFSGGSNDGHAKDCYMQTIPQTITFSGGNGGDGQLNGCANEPLGCFLAINLGNDTTFCDGQTLTLDAGAFPGGATYLWQDSSTNQTFVADTTGLYYVFVTDTGGCTGIDSITITVNPVPVVDLGNDTTFCNGNNLVLDAGNTGATYVWQNTATPTYQNQTLTANSTGIYFVTASFGTCSDTDSIEVIVNPLVTTNLTDSIICNGDSALIFGNYQTSAGTYRDTVLASTGCDSILVQQLIVNPTYNQNLGTVTICDGDSALIFGNYETVAGVYTDTLPSINSCDSIVSQTLNVIPTHIFSLGNDTAFCAGNNLTLDAGAGATSYLWMNNPVPSNQNQTLTIDTTGTYFVEATMGACTTTDTINVTVNPNQTTNLADSIVCNGDSALIFGTYETVAGTYYDTLSTYLGCDSILVQQLVVNPTYNYALTPISICAGDSALIFGSYQTVAGTYYDSTQTVNGCDSIVAQTLGVLSNTSVNLGNDTAICQGQSFTLDAGAGGSSYQWMSGTTTPFLQQTFTVNATGTYYVEVTTGSCSATDTINVTVNPNQTTNLADSIVCNGDSALIFGTYETVAGTYYDTLSTYLGCDSILVQQLIVNPTYNYALTPISICAGDSALIFGNYETVAGTYYNSTTTINGCDSIVAQTLNINPAPIVNLGNDTTFCSGNSLTLDAGAGATSYLWMNDPVPANQNQTFVVDTTGTYFVTATIGLCSATDSINVTVTQPVFTNLTDSVICQGDSALIFGNYETVAGTYYDTLISTLTTCDSILVQELVVNPTYNYALTPISICAGDSALIFGNYETVAGTYYDSTQTVNGCDSIVAQTLSINPAPVVNIGNDTTFCSGNSLTLDAGAGATSYLWMNDPVPANQNQTFVVDTTGTYFVTATIGLCSATDSINVTVTQPVFTNLTDEHICDGDSALIFGNYETVTGTYYDTLISTLTTCDSILVQELYVNPNVLTNNSIAICTGDSIFLGGAYQTVAGTYYDTLQTSAGCDSIVFTTLSVQAVQYTTLANISICQGDSVLIFGTYQTTAGTYYDTLATTALGCDSIIIQEVEVHALPIINLGEDTTLCHNEQLILDADTGHVSYLWNTNDTTQTITVVSDDLTVGVHEFYVTVSNQYNCSNTDTIEITIEICNGISSIENANVSIYPNPFKEFFYIKSDIEIKSVEVMDVLGAIVYQSDVHKYQTIVHSESISKGIYYVKVYFEGIDEFVIEKLLAK